MTDSITLVQSGGRDEWGEELATTSTTISARVQLLTELVMNADGEEIQVKGKVWIEDTDLDQEDKLTIDSVTYDIIPIQEAVGKDGTVHHLTLGIV